MYSIFFKHQFVFLYFSTSIAQGQIGDLKIWKFENAFPNLQISRFLTFSIQDTPGSGRFVLRPDKFQNEGFGWQGYWLHLYNQYAILCYSALQWGNAGSTSCSGAARDVVSGNCPSSHYPEIYPSRPFPPAKTRMNFYCLSDHEYQFPYGQYYNRRRQ